jgi:hypothetical protein
MMNKDTRRAEWRLVSTGQRSNHMRSIKVMEELAVRNIVLRLFIDGIREQ